MTDDVLKYQSVKVADEVDPATRQVEPDVKLPGDPEVPERVSREHEFGGEERGFGGAPREGSDESAGEVEAE
jgi:small subunit ribosomal protein S6